MKQNFHPELNSPITTAARLRRARLAALIFVSTIAATVAYPGAGCAKRPQNRGAPSAQSAAESGGFHALSRSEAASHAAALANAECDRLYGVQPFRENDNVAIRSAHGYRWGGLQVRGVDGFSALVTFRADGSEPHIEIYFSTDKNAPQSDTRVESASYPVSHPDAVEEAGFALLGYLETFKRARLLPSLAFMSTAAPNECV